MAIRDYYDAPACLGNCQQGRRDCTLPGVCSASRKVSEADLDARERERAAASNTPGPQRGTALPEAPEPIDWPSFRPLLLALLTLAAVALVGALTAIRTWGGA
jgi:hypothetical protein